MSKYVSEHPGGECIGFYKVPPRSKHNCALAALLWGPGTSLIIYPACVYLCWTRLCGGGGREKEGRQNPASLHVRSPQLQRDCWLCVTVCSRVRVYVWETEMAAIQPTWVMVWHTQTHTHKTFNCQKKKSLSRAPLCLMCSTLILPFRDICCCVNYTPPGALINTHTNMHTHQHTHKHTMYTI